MGCWGITALQSDSGLDAIGYIRDKLLEDGVLDLEIIIDTLRISSWNRPPKASEGPSHTSLMAVAELIIIYLDKEASSLDYEGKWAANDGKFASIHSFTASKESLKYLRDYLSDSLHYAKENAVLKAEEGKKWGGWFKEADWIGWQDHMQALVSRLDTLLASEETLLELVPPQENIEDRERKEKGMFLPEDGMTVTFSVIMLSGKGKKGEPQHAEIYTGGCIGSRFIPQMPLFKEFAEKCGRDAFIEVDDYAYELDGDNWHIRKAAKEEIQQIVGENFPHNYDAGILHTVSHDGPDQFYIKEGVLYDNRQKEDLIEQSLNL